MTRICIGQLVRPDGTVLTEARASEDSAPNLGHDPGNPYSPTFGLIGGPAYGRWRYSDEDEWRVVFYWPNGPDELPAFADNTGEGRFHSMDPADHAMERDETALALRQVAGVTPR